MHVTGLPEWCVCACVCARACVCVRVVHMYVYAYGADLIMLNESEMFVGHLFLWQCQAIVEG